jgi:hypothetical protein
MIRPKLNAAAEAVVSMPRDEEIQTIRRDGNRRHEIERQRNSRLARLKGEAFSTNHFLDQKTIDFVMRFLIFVKIHRQ